MKQIIIGLGEVGRALQNILKCDSYDFKEAPHAPDLKYGVLHICFPHSVDFVTNVKSYMHFFKCNFVIVHSTVPVGTCDAEGWVHSPVRGVHPNLELGIRTFVKYFGGENSKVAAGIFAEQGIPVRAVQYAKNTEAAKLWDTTQYGVMILLEKEIFLYCQNNGLDFDIVYSSFNESYNAGYTELGMPHVVRPFLAHKEGPIGGHCVVQNAELLHSFSGKRILRVNEKLVKRTKR